MLDLLPYDPRRHGVNVEPLNIATDTVRLYQRRASPHKRVGYAPVREGVGLVKQVLHGAISEFGKDQSSEKRARAAGEPFVDGDDRPVILLNLLLSQGLLRNEG